MLIPGRLAELACPHAGTVDDELGFDVTLVGAHARDDALVLQQAGGGRRLR